MSEKVLMSDYVERLLIDWTLIVDGQTLTGTWAFDRRKWSAMTRDDRRELLNRSALGEIKAMMSMLQVGDTGVPLSQMVGLSGWDTPTVAEANKLTTRSRDGIRSQLVGKTSESSPAETAKPAGSALNPAMSRWLQGYPRQWDDLAPSSKEWATAQRTLRESCGDLEAFSQWLLAIGLADFAVTGTPSAQ